MNTNNPMTRERLDVDEAMVERGARGFYEHSRSGMRSSKPSWDELVELFSEVADNYRDRTRAALNAALENQEEA